MKKRNSSREPPASLQVPLDERAKRRLCRGCEASVIGRAAPGRGAARGGRAGRRRRRNLPSANGSLRKRTQRSSVSGTNGSPGRRSTAAVATSGSVSARSRGVDAEQPDAEVPVGLDDNRVAVGHLLAGAAAPVAAAPEPGEPDREALGGLTERLRHRVAGATLAPPCEVGHRSGIERPAPRPWPQTPITHKERKWHVEGEIREESWEHSPSPAWWRWWRFQQSRTLR